MARVYVARHGETVWNVEGRYQGQRESKLSPRGMLQADALGRALSELPIARVISSPLSRCVDTAAFLAALLGVGLETDRRLIEIAHGTWEGRLRADIERDDATRMRQWRDHPERVAFEGGETLSAVVSRWDDFTASLAGDDRVAIVTHDVLVRIAILRATDRPLSEFWQPRVLNGAYAEFEVESGRWTLRDECVAEHLGNLAADTSGQAL